MHTHRHTTRYRHLNALVSGSIRSLHNFCPFFRLFLYLYGDEFQFAHRTNSCRRDERPHDKIKKK